MNKSNKNPRVRNKPGCVSNRAGRHVRKLDASTAFATAKYSRGKNTITCSRCPKFVKGFCSIRAKFMVATAQACNYGKVIIAAARQAEKWSANARAKRNTGSKKWSES